MKDERPDYNRAYIRRANMAKLMTVSKMAMAHRVMLSIDGDYLKSLSLDSWQTEERRQVFEKRYAVLGVFHALKNEARSALYRRLYDEAKACGALLGPPEPIE